MVDVAGQLENQAVNVPGSNQSLAQQAFETQVAPLREGQQERLTGTLESLSQRGIQFGELGSENIQDLLERESKAEKQLASEIGTSFGKTQMEQAFAASEAAKNRSLQTELTEKGFEFQAGENVLGRGFATSEREAQQEFVSGETAADREARLAESGAQRDFTAEQADISRQFAGTQAELGRDFTATETDRARDFAAEQNQLGMDFSETQAELGRTFAAEENALGRTFTSEESQRQRDFGLSTQESAQQFQAEQNQFGRTFTSEEAATQRTFQEAFAANREAFTAGQQDIAIQEDRNRLAIELALSGNLDAAGAQQALKDTFGPGTVLTTQDEQDLQRIATASGLSVEDYTTMRKAIGEGQLAEIIANPEDFIENPAKARAFEVSLSQAQANAARASAGLPPIETPKTTEDVDEATAIASKEFAVKHTQWTGRLEQLRSWMTQVGESADRAKIAAAIDEIERGANPSSSILSETFANTSGGFVNFSEAGG